MAYVTTGPVLRVAVTRCPFCGVSWDGDDPLTPDCPDCDMHAEMVAETIRAEHCREWETLRHTTTPLIPLEPAGRDDDAG